MSRAAKPEAAGAGDFRGIADSLKDEVIEALDAEHLREVNELYEEELQLREELKRIVTLMSTEIVPREQMMHDMIENMHNAMEAAVGNLHGKMSGAMGGQDSSKKRQELMDPMKAMEKELDRIAKLLQHEVVKPNIAGWKAPGGSSPGRSPQRPAAR